MERSRFFDAMDPIQWQWHRELLRILVRPAAGEVLSFSLCTAPWVIESASAAQPAAAAGEHDASDKTFRPPDGDQFYITTAINYTNGRAPPLTLARTPRRRRALYPKHPNTVVCEARARLLRRFCSALRLWRAGPPHMGHAYEAVTTDVLARYHRTYGRQVRSSDGTAASVAVAATAHRVPLA